MGSQADGVCIFLGWGGWAPASLIAWGVRGSWECYKTFAKGSWEFESSRALSLLLFVCKFSGSFTVHGFKGPVCCRGQVVKDAWRTCILGLFSDTMYLIE